MKYNTPCLNIGSTPAPNGLDSKLTERQWLHVRTKAFKKWFGDWERLAELGIKISKIKSEILKKDSNFEQENEEELSNKAIQWATEHLDELADKYIKEHKNVLDPDAVRDLFKPIGYNPTTNLQAFRNAEEMLVEAFYEKMLEKAVKEGKTSITYVSGAAGSGKSTSVKNNKDINLTNEGIVFDSAFNRYEGLAKKIEKAKKAGMKNISVIAVYNDAITTFKNSIERGKKIGRFLSLQYFLDRSFGMSKDKLKLLNTNYPDVNIIPLDNSNNQGGKRVSVDEALNWDYRVNEELLYNILTILENEYINNKLNEQQISSISRGILQISSLTTPRVQQLAARFNKEVEQNKLLDGQRRRAERLGLEQLQQEYETLKASISGAVDPETLEPIPVYHSNESNNINEFTEGTIVTPLTITPKNSEPTPNTITIDYTPKGKTKQTYNVKKEGDSWHIYNKDGKEVFKQDSKDRKRIPHRASSRTIRIKTSSSRFCSLSS